MEKKKVLLIVNPRSGRNKSRAATFDIVNRFDASKFDFTVKTTTCQGDATNIVKNCIADNDMVVCCGGDGTFNETINGVMQLSKRVPIGYIPAGSTNDLASTIGLPTDIVEATEIIKRGNTNSYDIGLFNNKFFSYVASFGAASNLSYSTPQSLKNALGHSAYILNGLVINLIPTLKSVKPIHIRIEYDGGVMEDDFFFGSISNSTSVGGIFKFNRSDVKLDDGKFEVLLVRGIKNPLQSFGLLSKIQKKEYDGEKIIYFKTSTLKLTFAEAKPWTLDGEYGGEHKEVRFAALNKAIDIVSGPNDMFIGDRPAVSEDEKEKEAEKEPENPEK